MKVCLKCERERRPCRKPESEFYKRERSSDGLQTVCKECSRTLCREQTERIRRRVSAKKAKKGIINSAVQDTVDGVKSGSPEL